MIRRRDLLLATPALALAACSRPKTPAGQPALTTLNPSAFRDAFNAAADTTRVIALLSPT